MRSIIANIYSNRNFHAADGLGKSDVHPQEFGISQGCPLSPFLFNIMMTILVHDAKRMLQDELGISLFFDLPIHELLYADDTLLLEVDDERLQKFMECIKQCGASYGLELNWAKIDLMGLRKNAILLNDEGFLFEMRDSLKYLGALHIESD